MCLREEAIHTCAESRASWSWESEGSRARNTCSSHINHTTTTSTPLTSSIPWDGGWTQTRQPPGTFSTQTMMIQTPPLWNTNVGNFLKEQTITMWILNNYHLFQSSIPYQQSHQHVEERTRWSKNQCELVSQTGRSPITAWTARFPFAVGAPFPFPTKALFFTRGDISDGACAILGSSVDARSHGSFYPIYTQERVMLLLTYDAARLTLLLWVARGVTECDAPRVTTSFGGAFGPHWSRWHPLWLAAPPLPLLKSPQVPPLFFASTSAFILPMGRGVDSHSPDVAQTQLKASPLNILSPFIPSAIPLHLVTPTFSCFHFQLKRAWNFPLISPHLPPSPA